MILVFGQSGQLATELERQAVARGQELRRIGRTGADLMSPGTAREAIISLAPAMVINAAAWTAVDTAEAENDAAERLNAQAPGEMAVACAELGIPFLHVSTDYVFDGSGTAPWQETDPPAPQNVYGRTKQAGEDAVLAAGGQAIVLRTSWVFSAHGANFVKTMLRLSETRDRLSVVDDQVGGPTPASDIAATLLTLGTALRDGTPVTGNGIYHYAGAPAVSWAGFAREIFAQTGRFVTVTGIPSRDYPTPAVRPLNSRLDCAKLATDFGINQPSWQDGLTAVLKEMDA